MSAKKGRSMDVARSQDGQGPAPSDAGIACSIERPFTDEELSGFLLRLEAVAECARTNAMIAEDGAVGEAEHAECDKERADFEAVVVDVKRLVAEVQRLRDTVMFLTEWGEDGEKR